MNADHKKILRAVSLELRHTLEGSYDDRGDFQPGDLENRLNAIGVWRNRPAKPLAELTHLPDEDKTARQVVDAYLSFRAEAGVGQAEAVAEFVREAAYNWANRLLTLRCMEARGIIDEVILQKEVYGGRSMLHNRLGQRNPALLDQPDEGLFTVLLAEFAQRARELPTLFNPKAPAIALRPSLAALKRCVGLLSGTVRVGSYEAAGDELFAAPDALGWAYQYWNAEEKDRVFEKVRTEKGAKIAGADIIPATQLYTEPYMVKFLVQNSLGALWMGMYPDSDLADGWEYYVRDADRTSVEKKPVRDITFLDPACGSGHFHLEAFDLLYAMYEAETAHSPLATRYSPEEICAAILNHNLYGIDIDERAIQIAQAALWMKAKEVAWELEPEALTDFHHHFVATNIRLPQGKDHLELFLRKHPEDLPLRPALETVFEGLVNAHELGSLLQLEEPVEKELRYLQGKQVEATQTPSQGNLFAELAKPSQGALPLGVESYDAWKAKTLAQLRAHFEAEAEAADLTQAFFGQSAGKGLALFDILARRYDVVAANPPWMGSKNMGDVSANYLTKNFKSAKRDLYATFIVRCVELCKESGFVSMITQQSWLFLNSYAELRANSGRCGLLNTTRMGCLVHLGRYAFSELGNAVIQPVLFTLKNVKCDSHHRIFSVRLNAPRDSQEQDRLLKLGIANPKEQYISFNKQVLFLRISGSPLVYWLPQSILSILETETTFSDLCGQVRAGISSANSSRYVRYFWEHGYSDRWWPLAKGGGYRKWIGLNFYVHEWQFTGVRVKGNPSAAIRNEEFMGQKGWSYTLMAGGSISVRSTHQGFLYDFSGSAIFPSGKLPASILNCRVCSYLLRVVTQDIKFAPGYVSQMPVPTRCESFYGLIEKLTKVILQIKGELVSRHTIESSFINFWLPDSITPSIVEYLDAVLLTLEGVFEDVCRNAYGLSDSEFRFLLNEMGVPSGLYPTIEGYDSFPELQQLTNPFLSDVQEFLKLLPRINSSVNLPAIRNQVKTLYELGPGIELDEPLKNYLNTDTENEEEMIGARILTPAETFLEELSHKLEIHPISVYWLLKEGIEQEGWRCTPEEKRLTEDRFTVTVLHLLGHRWPTQIEANEPVPPWAEPSGIIPLTGSSPNQPTLYDRVRDRLAADFPNDNPTAIEREFADIVGAKLADWLAGSFFNRHISQFKKRPIAWQVQTSPAPGQRQRGGPAFAALLYYHKLSADLLPTLRNQTTRDLIRAYETEQRTLRQSQNRSSEQEARLHQLETWLTELQTFSDALQHVSERGFGDTPALQTSLRQYALDDAMQSLKATWLRRLADAAADTALPDWQTRADKTHIHPALRDWIADATAHLPYHCAQVGAAAPQAAKLKTDPDARTLATIIGSQAREMVSQALRLSDDAWFNELDTHVLRPLLDEINTLKEQQTALESQRDNLEPQDVRGRYENEQAIKSLKAQIKKKSDARNAHRKAANELRQHIESWQCAAAVGWTDWLGQQSLFDQFASLDGQRQPPQTIADFVAQESRYIPDINDGVRVNIAPLQKAGLLAADVLAAKELDKAIADRADWRADERRWCREGKLPRPGWWLAS